MLLALAPGATETKPTHACTRSFYAWCARGKTLGLGNVPSGARLAGSCPSGRAAAAGQAPAARSRPKERRAASRPAGSASNATITPRSANGPAAASRAVTGPAVRAVPEGATPG